MYHSIVLCHHVIRNSKSQVEPFSPKILEILILIFHLHKNKVFLQASTYSKCKGLSVVVV